MKPYISVIVPTMRIGGLDILFEGLEGQTFKEFELVLVDSLYEYRKDLIKEKSKNYSFKVKHLSALNEDKFTATGYCRSMNTGIVNSSGHLAFFICDYTWLEPCCLQNHANFHKYEKINPNTALLCSYNYVKLPELNSDFNKIYAHNIPYDTEENRRKYITQELECFNEYVNDLNSGKLNNLMWSILRDPFIANSNPRLLPFELTDVKTNIPEGPVNSKCCFLKNESYVMDSLLKINGLNEALDGSHGWQDIEFADRLVSLLGTNLYCKPLVTSITVNPRSIMYGRSRSRGVYDNEAIWKDGTSSNFKNRVNSWVLKDNLVKEENE
jgi:glycosyltransferase involved in cell wall biosynthesis